MNPSRFDRVARLFAERRLSRRDALTRLGGLTATGLAAAELGRAGDAVAQGTPSPAAAPNQLAANNATLFVQTATGGTFTPNPQAGTPVAATNKLAGTHGSYLVTLQGHSGETIAFSDRPARQFGEVPTTQFFTSMGFTPANPPNAALVADTPQQQDAVYLVELMTPAYDAGTQTLTYEANLLHQYPNARGSALAPLAAKAQSLTPAATFGSASLFIDDCADADPLNCCLSYIQLVGNLGDRGMCWSWHDWSCHPCSGDWSGTANECNQQFSACLDSCYSSANYCNPP